jgi:membrane protein DedA with SNARE-associated domain
MIGHRSPAAAGGNRRGLGMVVWLLAWIHSYGYLAIAGLLAVGIFGLPIPDETLLVCAGTLVANGKLEMLPTFGAALLGSWCGITASYVLGRTAGHGAIAWIIRRRPRYAEHFQRAQGWFVKAGRWLLTFGYFVPGLRHVTALLAGAMGIRLPTFVTFAYGGGLLWVTCFLTLGYFLGHEWLRMPHYARRLLVVGAVVLAVAAYAAFVLVRRWARRRRAGG